MESESALDLRRSSSISPSWIAGAIIFFLIAVAGITWAKWWPYSHKLATLLASQSWSGGSIFDKAGAAGSAPSLHGALEFTVTYIKSIWIALVAGLAIASATEAFMPRRWLIGVLTRKARFGSSIVGGLLAIPCMMCTCCGAPVAATLRRDGVPASASLAYWVGNPTLNPAVLAFLIVVAPWQWMIARLVVGALLVFVVTTLVANVAGAPTVSPEVVGVADKSIESDFSLGEAPQRFAKALFRLCITLIPEYFAVVFLLGLFRGWLFPFGSASVNWGVLAVLLAAIVGTLMVIPTAGEIPILLGLSSIGAGPAVLGALLITLPAISLPSMAMVGRAMSMKVTAAMAAGVAACGLISGGLLWAILR